MKNPFEERIKIFYDEFYSDTSTPFKASLLFFSFSNDAHKQRFSDFVYITFKFFLLCSSVLRCCIEKIAATVLQGF